MNVLDIFSGIGGFSLGLKRAGMRTVAFCEIDKYCRLILAKHWPGIPCYEDVRELTAEKLRTDGIAVDTICGGFPCQDISTAGPGTGIEGARSGLWKEYARLIGDIRPRYIIVENTATLLGRGLSTVLGNLSTLGYDAEWHCIPASAIGASHRRDRIWVIAYPNSVRCRGWSRGSILNRQDLEGQKEKWSEVWLETEKRILHYIQNPAAAPEDTRGNYGFPDWVDRMRSLGNSVVPQIPELIGRAIMDAEASR